jgi:hypothetical protein
MTKVEHIVQERSALLHIFSHSIQKTKDKKLSYVAPHLVDIILNYETQYEKIGEGKR